jgi:UDPglucose 6-dehydrogenase
MKSVQISIIGSGIVGKAVGKVFADCGYDVVFYDTNENCLSLLTSQGYKISRDLKEVILSTNLSFICVPTPTTQGNFDSSYLEEIHFEMGRILDSKEDYHLVAIKSTVLPGVIESLEPNLEKQNYGFCLNPEFLRSETPEEDFRNLDFVIIGGFDEKASLTLKVFYEDFKERIKREFEIVTTDPKTAAMIKYVSNCLLATKISFFNEVQEVCRRLGVDTEFVMNYTLTDRVSTPEWYKRKFLLYGFQDECLPKDLDAFITFCENLSPLLRMEVLRSARRVNWKKLIQGEAVVLE